MVKKRVQRRRQEKEEELQMVPNWSELHMDLLQAVFKRLSFISLNRAKLVCSSWYSASKDCVPNKNQSPWLISFSPNSRSCELLVPEDKETVYKSREFDVDFARTYCVATCGSWILMLNCHFYKLYILNPLIGETVDLPYGGIDLIRGRSCFWIDNKTKDYLVVIAWSEKFIKKGYENWEKLPIGSCEDIFYNEKNQELYVHDDFNNINIWDFSGDKPRKNRTVTLPYFYCSVNDFLSFLKRDELNKASLIESRMAVTVSGEFLKVSYIEHRKTWYFRIYKTNKMDNKWVPVDSLGDEALIYDMGITVVANGSIPGIKKNSIYFSNKHYYPIGYLHRQSIFVYDLTTHQKELLPKCALGNISFTKSRWFFPC